MSRHGGPEPTPRTISLGGARVAALVVAPEHLEAWTREHDEASWLSPEERAAFGGLDPRIRADRLASRLALKLLVRNEERHAEADLAAIATTPDQHGRPILMIGEQRADASAVSLAHARGWGAAALARDGRVGIDIEHPRAALQLAARRLLGPDDHPDDEEGILRLWVVKEAAAKAWGAGVDLPLREVRVIEEDDGISVTMPEAAAHWDASLSLDGAAARWSLGDSQVAVAYFLTRAQFF